MQLSCLSENVEANQICHFAACLSNSKPSRQLSCSSFGHFIDKYVTNTLKDSRHKYVQKIRAQDSLRGATINRHLVGCYLSCLWTYYYTRSFLLFAADGFASRCCTLFCDSFAAFDEISLLNGSFSGGPDLMSKFYYDET